MPHGRSADGDDFASTDEVKIYKDEGEDEKRSSENLSEEKFGLVTETEEVYPCCYYFYDKSKSRAAICAFNWTIFG